MNLGFQSKIKNRMAHNVDPDETACYEPSLLDLHCLHRYICSGLPDCSKVNVRNFGGFIFVLLLFFYMRKLSFLVRNNTDEERGAAAERLERVTACQRLRVRAHLRPSTEVL